MRAFVGHSFAADDSQLVSGILAYLDGIASLNPKFSWDHAKHPEPTTTVDAKVLALFEGKNLFIGICTRNERVIPNIDLQRCWFSRSRATVDETRLEWKASDWIIQEIGLAVGRDMHVILLVEDGLRRPGALQGNLEHIPLSRQAPEKSFDALLGMLAKLCQEPAMANIAAKEEASQAAQDVEPKNDIEEGGITPKAEWTKRDYKFALMHCIATKNAAAEKEVNTHFLASEAGRNEQDRREWIAQGEYYRIVFANKGDLSRLENLQLESPENSEISACLARGYLHYQEHKKAADAFECAARTANDAEKQIRLLGEAALWNQKAGNSAKARELAGQLRKVSHDTGRGEVEVLKAERLISKEQKNDEAEIAAQERLLEIRPADDETRFSLAYKYSELSRDELAAYHYSRILPENRGSTAWNNLGVALAKLGMPIKAVEAYRVAEKQGETLAMSNLAHKLSDAGFVPEARKILEVAMAINDHHKNVDKALGIIDEAVEAEQKKETEAFAKARPIYEYYRQFGQALSRPDTINLAGRWRAPKCTLELLLQDDSVVALGTYEVKTKGAGLLSALAIGIKPTASATPASEQYELKFQGTIRGGTIIGTIIDRPVDSSAGVARSLLADVHAESPFLMWIDDAGTELHVCEYDGSSKPTFYSLIRE